MKRRILLAITALLMMAASLGAAPRRNMYVYHHRQPSTMFFGGFGLTFAYTNSSYRHVDLTYDAPVSSATLHGFTIGLSKDYTLVQESLYFQMGLNYIFQNDSRDQNIEDPKIKLIGDREEHHIAIPLRLKYNLPIVSDIGLTFDAGPTLLMGMYSRFNYRTRIDEKTALSASYNIFNAKVESHGTSHKFDLVNWMEESGMYPYGKTNRFDVMLGAAVGAHFFEILELRLGYDWGLLNRYKKGVSEIYSLRRGQFSLSVGIRF